MKRLVFLVGLIIMLGFIVILLLPKQSFNDENMSFESTVDLEEEENQMNKRINKVQTFNPEVSSNKNNNDLSFSLSEIKDTTSSNKSFEYTITNEGTAPVKLSFTTSQRYEYELSSKEKGTFHRYSDGKMFMQVLQDITLSPQEEMSYTISLPSLEKGAYVLTVSLAASSINDSSKTIKFTIGE